MKFADNFQDWMDKATSMWESMPAQWHTILIISAVALLILLVLGIVKSFIKTWVRVILVVVIVGLVCTAFPWVGAALLSLIDYAWTSITGG
ncbi:MAG: hypothetical protein LBG99_07250 [Propionibacteriaceae bacterium]|nr:hypothetical protein [Propionibacteriaceae bacterium]